MRSDPRMKNMGETMPFDGMRMIYGGFDSIVDERAEGKLGYADGYIVPVPDGNKEAYRKLAQKMSAVFIAYGATPAVEAWSADVPDGKVRTEERRVGKEGG